MRAEDYKPCAWNHNTMAYGDYPQLNYQNAGDVNSHHDWDDYMYRRNYGDPISVYNEYHANFYAYQSIDVINGCYYDYQKALKLYFIVYYLSAIVVCAYFYWTINNNCFEKAPDRLYDYYNSPWFFDDGFYHSKEFMDSWNKGYRFLGGHQGCEDDRVERWGMKYAENYVIKGWGDLSRAPDYTHTW